MVIDLESIIIFKITKDFYLLLGLAWILHVYKLSNVGNIMDKKGETK